MQGNVLVSVVRGAMGPQLERTIREQLEHEHNVLDGKTERKPVSAIYTCTCTCTCMYTLMFMYMVYNEAGTHVINVAVAYVILLVHVYMYHHKQMKRSSIYYYTG